jgi:hypothetical protein
LPTASCGSQLERQRADPLEPVHHAVGNLRIAFDLEPEVTEEQLLAETWQLPLGLPRRLDDVASLLL